MAVAVALALKFVFMGGLRYAFDNLTITLLFYLRKGKKCVRLFGFYRVFRCYLGNNIGAKGAEALAVVLPNLISLLELNLSG